MKRPEIEDSIDHVTEAALDETSLRLVPPGSLLLVVRGMILAHSVPVATTEVPVTINQDMKALVPDREIVHPVFFRYSLQGLEAALLSLVEEAGHGTRCLRSELWRRFEIPLPPLPTQRAIADFLDRKTSHLDALIEKKQKLLDLLAEKRAALIHQAVTQGLDPSVPRKDSGIPWIGEIPAHWDVLRLKQVCPDVTVGIVITPSKYYVDNGVPALRSLNIRPGTVDLTDLVRISEIDNQRLFKSQIHTGDIVAVRTGQPGTAAVVPEALSGANCIDLLIIRKSAEIEPDFLCFFLQSEAALGQFISGSTGAIQSHFNVGTARDLLVAVPPYSEQEKISSLLRQRLELQFETSTKTSVSIDRLREYRQALITAAVTGQLDIEETAA